MAVGTMKQILFILCIMPFAVMITANRRNTEVLFRAGSNKFTTRMFFEITNANPQKSVVLSAISVMPPLAEIALASIGESHDELLEALEIPDDDTITSVFSYINTQLQSTEAVTLKTANKIYVASRYELNSAFAAVSKDIFNSEVQNIDFEDNENAANEVNTWVEQQTNHRIKDLVDPKSIDGSTRALLVNAIYFKGLWQDPFDKAVTEIQDFHVNQNHVINVPMMNRKAYYGYTENDDLKSQILEIPYKGYHASLIVVLPRDIEGITGLVKKLKDPNVLDNALKMIYGTEVEVKIPKFKIETTTNLKNIFLKMNITKIFDEETARLYNLLKNAHDLYIDSAVQKAFIEVNEEGAEAAAGNEMGAVGGSASVYVKDPIVFNANRPFYFAIKMESFILFNGVMGGV